MAAVIGVEVLLGWALICAASYETDNVAWNLVHFDNNGL